MRNSLYHSSVVERKNRFFYLALLVSTAMVSLIVVILMNIVFHERYQSTGLVSPLSVLNMGVEYGGLIKENKIISGNHYVKGDVLLIYDRQEEVLKQGYLRRKYKILSSQRERLKGNIGLFEVESLDLKMNDIKHELTLLDRVVNNKTLVMPFDGVVVSGSLSSMQHNRVEAGDIIAKVAETSEMVVSVTIPHKWVGKVQSGDRVLLTYNAAKHESKVRQIMSVESGDGLTVSALVEMPISLTSNVGLGTSLRATIYTGKVSFKDVFMRALIGV